MKKKIWIYAAVIFIILMVFCSVIRFSDTQGWLEGTLNIIRMVFLALVILPWLIIAVLAFIPKTRDCKYFPNSSYFVIIFYGVLLVMSSINKDLLSSWSLINSNSFSIGIAFLALGWALLPKETKEPEATLKQEKSETNQINTKLENLDKKFNEMRNTISTTFTKLGEEIKKQKDKE